MAQRFSDQDGQNPSSILPQVAASSSTGASGARPRDRDGVSGSFFSRRSWLGDLSSDPVDGTSRTKPVAKDRTFRSEPVWFLVPVAGLSQAATKPFTETLHEPKAGWPERRVVSEVRPSNTERSTAYLNPRSPTDLF